ncbi:MAG: hypothetical protein JWS12_62 [Candidatus Saccharibacteria bacterium]|nr:hypothetical protein [Candidatus Saccharibacteria bacterium]
MERRANHTARVDTTGRITEIANCIMKNAVGLFPGQGYYNLNNVILDANYPKSRTNKWKAIVKRPSGLKRFHYMDYMSFPQSAGTNLGLVASFF